MAEMSPSSRVQMPLAPFHAARPEVFAERAVLAARACAQTEDRPMLLGRARMMEEVLGGVTVLIRDGELIVGCKTPAILRSPEYPGSL